MKITLEIGVEYVIDRATGKTTYAAKYGWTPNSRYHLIAHGNTLEEALANVLEKVVKELKANETKNESD